MRRLGGESVVEPELASASTAAAASKSLLWLPGDDDDT